MLFILIPDGYILLDKGHTRKNILRNTETSEEIDVEEQVKIFYENKKLTTTGRRLLLLNISDKGPPYSRDPQRNIIQYLPRDYGEKPPEDVDVKIISYQEFNDLLLGSSSATQAVPFFMSLAPSTKQQEEKRAVSAARRDDMRHTGDSPLST